MTARCCVQNSALVELHDLRSAEPFAQEFFSNVCISFSFHALLTTRIRIHRVV